MDKIPLFYCIYQGDKKYHPYAMTEGKIYAIYEKIEHILYYGTSYGIIDDNGRAGSFPSYYFSLPSDDKIIRLLYG